ncbi:hypothetical protein HT136_22290 [Novosphingobium profundi]|uniref:hypothetical protein n=1 Tax=Novosphingobium profundi TaxID=1774954 RepID=UPI001BD9B9D1|nr:hypothetical protein [Novosphingobium profundi]MBT0671106.1 hypothetical protein [Novosphingobium profundi]
MSAVIYACGHSRGRKFQSEDSLATEYHAPDRKSGNLCPHCRSKHQLRRLRGSDRQIQWAKAIRKSLDLDLSNFFQRTTGVLSSEDITQLDWIVSYVHSHESAAEWWIQNRLKTPLEFLEQAIAKCPENIQPEGFQILDKIS